MASLKDQIRAATDIRHQDDVEIPEWVPGARFRVYGLPSGDWEAYQNSLTKMTRKDSAQGIEMSVKSRKAEIVAKGLYDQETDERVFPDLREGIAILSQRSAGIVNALFELIRHLSDDGKDFAQRVQEAEAGFGDGPS
ncbi:hypothetical protein [Streptomyces nymphaeiformis]|jgi:hypothetical protein|uniref:Tail assembly chaperone n=1 Tax=Streptomyces nymphaeiformis TaxID=2663842 RepID=A0A7W7XGP0_9ACTN|nr:hypothetical protein [Streptomyces nymphaeiformis]MBB4987497.1 hypothetical protein [Streptomyces nymphaeiformis]